MRVCVVTFGDAHFYVFYGGNLIYVAVGSDERQTTLRGRAIETWYL